MPALYAPSPEFNFPEEPLILRLQGAACWIASAVNTRSPQCVIKKVQIIISIIFILLLL